MFKGIRDWLVGSMLQQLGMLYNHQLQFERQIMTSQAELAQKVNGMTGTLEKVRAEVQALKDGVASGQIADPELVAAVDRMEAALKGVDDINQDAPTGEGEGQAEGDAQQG